MNTKEKGKTDMQYDHLKTYRERFERILKDGQAICSPYAAKSPEVKAATERFARFCGERLKDLNPKLMVYGIYNAGKSTLVNAMLGGEYAPVGDVPTTKAINAYDWREYTIYDTPGINAPEKDEAVSKEQLEKSDVVLFVMDTEGDFSMGKNYRELAEIAKSKKRLLIVLNDKTGFDFRTQAAEIAKIESRVYEDFASLVDGATPKELVKRFRLVTVNAQRALKARTREGLTDEVREALVRASNIEALEAAVVEEYEKASGLTILAQLATMFGSELDQLSRRLGELQKDVLARRGQEALEELRTLQERIRSRVVDFAKDQEGLLRDEIRTVLENSTDEDVAGREIRAAGERLAKKVGELLDRECANASLQLESAIGRFEQCAVDLKGVVPEGVAEEAKKASARFAKDGEKSAGAAPGIKSMATTAALRAAKPLVGKALGKAAAAAFGKAIPYIGLAIAAVEVIGFIFGESGAEREQRERYEELEAQAEASERRQRDLARWRGEVASNAGRTARALVAELIERIGQALDDMFAPSFERINGTIAANRAEETTLVRDIAALSDLKGELVRFTDETGA